MAVFAGKTVLVTGATSGIGAAVARHLAGLGARLVLTGRDGDRAEAVAQDCHARGAAGVEIALSDLTALGAPEAAVDLALSTGGSLDVLVNNAGILFRGDALDCTDDEWEATMATNVTAVFRMSRAALRVMVPQQRGAIVNVASDWGLVGARGALAYGVSKGAVVQMTRSMALDHARQGIRINAVCPGDTDTLMLDSAIEGPDRAQGLTLLGEAIPMGRVGTPEEVAEAVAFLASDASRFVTGALLPVDGGNSAQ